jgi:hypothetical protein
MLLPSGPANTRCSVCRVDPGSLQVPTATAPGTGLESPETGSQNRGYRGLTRQQRLDVPHLNARKSPQIAGNSSETWKRRFVFLKALDGNRSTRGIRKAMAAIDKSVQALAKRPPRTLLLRDRGT